MDDLISRKAAIRWIKAECNPYGKPTLDYETSCRIMEHLDRMSPAQQKVYTKADYIMALHREYGCTLTRAEEAHDKALEYLRSKATMKG